MDADRDLDQAELALLRSVIASHDPSPFVPVDAGTQFLQQSPGPRIREDERSLLSRLYFNRRVLTAVAGEPRLLDQRLPARDLLADIFGERSRAHRLRDEA